MYDYNDELTKELVLNYQTKIHTLDEVENVLALMIYNFPLIQFGVKEKDILSDFYTYFLERFDKVLNNYRPRENTMFKTYFYFALKRHYINFTKSMRRNIILELQDMTEFMDSRMEYAEDNSDNDEKIKQCIESKMKQKDLIFLKLFYPEMLTKEDCYFLGEKMGISFLEVINRLEILLEDIFDKSQKSHTKIRRASAKSVGSFLGWPAHKVTKKLSGLRKRAQL